MNLLQIRSTVYSILDTDEEDIPTALIDLWALEGFQQIVGTERRWPTWQVASTLTWPALTPSVEIGGLEFNPTPREVVRIIDPSNRTRLYNRPHAVCVEEFANDTGDPVAWSVWGNRLYLWPVPAQEMTFTAMGYRAPLAWQEDPSAQIDCDELFHIPILHFVLSRAYARQEDIDLASYFTSLYATGVQAVVETVMTRNESDESVILNGNHPLSRAERMAFSLEV